MSAATSAKHTGLISGLPGMPDGLAQQLHLCIDDSTHVEFLSRQRMGHNTVELIFEGADEQPRD